MNDTIYSNNNQSNNLNNTQRIKIPRRIAQSVISSLKGGVVPRVGLPFITVGRRKEIEALLHDVDIVGEGGASFRFIVGKYGSGKSFLLQTIRNYVMDRQFVVVDADLSPERRLRQPRTRISYLPRADTQPQCEVKARRRRTRHGPRPMDQFGADSDGGEYEYQYG